MYVYRFLNEEKEVIYVGKSKNIKQRFIQHFEVDNLDWKKEVKYIDYIEFEDGATMDIYEVYYIDKLKPKYNKANKYNNTFTKIILPELNFKNYNNNNYLKEHVNLKDKNLLQEFDKQKLLDRYILYIPKNKNFIKSTKHSASNEEFEFINKKIINVIKNKVKCKRDECIYTIHYSFINKIKNNILNDKYYVHYKNSSNAFTLFYLSDFNSENKTINYDEDCLNNLLNFMTINKTTDKNNKTYLFLATEKSFNLLYNYLDKKIEIKYC